MSGRQWFVAGLAVLIGVAIIAMPADAAGRKAKEPKATTPAAPLITLPEAAAKAVKDAFPSATTGLVKMVNEGGMMLYSVGLWEVMNEKTAVVSADGAIAAVKTPTAIGDIPEAAAKAIRNADEGAIVSRIEKVEVRAEVKDDAGTPKLVRCATPGTAYEGTLAKGYQIGRIKVAEDGKVLSPISWESKPPEPPVKARGGKGGGGKKKNK